MVIHDVHDWQKYMIIHVSIIIEIASHPEEASGGFGTSRTANPSQCKAQKDRYRE